MKTISATALKEKGSERFAKKAIRSCLSTFSSGCMVMLLIAFFISTQFVAAQKIDTSLSATPQASYHFYLEKHKTNKTIAWLLLAPGATMITEGGIIRSKNTGNIFTSGFRCKPGAELSFLGSVMAFTSIHFFISAGNNRKKATLSLKREKVPFGYRGPGNYPYTAVTLKIKL